MTDRLNGVFVAFENDIRADDAEVPISAIKCLRGVLAVTPSITTADDYLHAQRARRALIDKLWEVLRE